jgi:hypothetical protein
VEVDGLVELVGDLGGLLLLLLHVDVVVFDEQVSDRSDRLGFRIYGGLEDLVCGDDRWSDADTAESGEISVNGRDWGDRRSR